VESVALAVPDDHVHHERVILSGLRDRRESHVAIGRLEAERALSADRRGGRPCEAGLAREVRLGHGAARERIYVRRVHHLDVGGDETDTAAGVGGDETATGVVSGDSHRLIASETHPPSTRQPTTSRPTACFARLRHNHELAISRNATIVSTSSMTSLLMMLS